MSTKSAKSIRCKNMMLTQDLEHLSYNIDHLQLLLESLNAKHWAFIIHNDKEEFKHVHAVLEFENARSINSIAKILQVKSQYLEQWKGSVKNAYSYLLHRTNEARKKNKKFYQPNEVKANFDFENVITDIESEISSKSNTKKEVNNLLDLFDLELLSRNSLEEELSGSQFANVVRKIDSIERKINSRKFRKFREKMSEEQKKIETIWIFGETGTGKTRLAKDIATSDDKKYYFSGSNNDPFQGYLGESSCILDELRPSTFNYNELLKLLDPFGFETVASSRYFDKPLTVEQFIITTPFDPKSFYERIKGLDSKIDKPDQLFRRITLVVNITTDAITPLEYDPITKSFMYKKEISESNPYFVKDDLNAENRNSDYFGKLVEVIKNEER